MAVHNCVGVRRRTQLCVRGGSLGVGVGGWGLVGFGSCRPESYTVDRVSGSPVKTSWNQVCVSIIHIPHAPTAHFTSFSRGEGSVHWTPPRFDLFTCLPPLPASIALRILRIYGRQLSHVVRYRNCASRVLSLQLACALIITSDTTYAHIIFVRIFLHTRPPVPYINSTLGRRLQTSLSRYYRRISRLTEGSVRKDRADDTEREC
jgi:hypothetical protein